MARRFGFGEYEKADVEVRDSTWEMRHQFLTVVSAREQALRDLVLPANLHLFLSGLSLSDQDFIYFVLVVSAFGKPIKKAEICRENFNTPFNHFVRYLDEKSDEIDSEASDLRKNRRLQGERDVRSDAIRRIVGDWLDLKDQESAAKLSAALTDWAMANNLNEDWIIDFILMLLKNLKVAFDTVMFNLTEISVDESATLEYSYIFESVFNKAKSEALLEHHSRRVMINIWRYDESPQYPPFEFKYKDFVMKPVTWFPHIIVRPQFISDFGSKFESVFRALRDLDKFPDFDAKSYYPKLETHCDSVEAALKNNLDRSSVPPCSVCHLDELVFNAATWDPSILTRAEFIREYTKELTRGFEFFKAMAKSLDSKVRSHLDLKLFSYCNQVEKLVPKTYERTREKYNNTHFHWLVDFQIPPYKSYKQIALGEPEGRQISEDAVRKAILRLSKVLGLKLRAAPKTGRPKGIIEKKRRGHDY